jgi:hypothetical protein
MQLAMLDFYYINFWSFHEMRFPETNASLIDMMSLRSVNQMFLCRTMINPVCH